MLALSTVSAEDIFGGYSLETFPPFLGGANRRGGAGGTKNPFPIREEKKSYPQIFFKHVEKNIFDGLIFDIYCHILECLMKAFRRYSFRGK